MVIAAGQPALADDVNNALNARLLLSGGVLTGPLTLAGDAAANLQPVSLQQLNNTVSSGYLPLSGGTLSGGLTVSAGGINVTGASSVVGNFTIGSNTITTIFTINSPSGINRNIFWQSAGVNRWGLTVTNAAESGSNVGSDFRIAAYSDAGAAIFFPIAITRSTGLVSIANGLTVSGGTTTLGTTTAPTQGGGDNSTNVATTQFVSNMFAVNSNSVVAGSNTFTAANTNCDVIYLSGSPASAVTVVMPVNAGRRTWSVYNNCGQTATITPGTGVAIPNGQGRRLWTDGSAIYAADGGLLPLTGGTMSGGLSFGSAVAASATDTSRHIALFGSNQYGFSITSGTLNIVAASNNTIAVLANAVNTNNADVGILSTTTSGRALSWRTTGNGTDQNIWDATVSGASFLMRAVNDAYSAATNWLQVTRSGYGITGINFFSPWINFNGNTVVQNSGLYVQNTSGYANIYLSKSGSGQGNQIVGNTGTGGGNIRWNMHLGNADAETGSNAGSNFAIYNYSDTGAYLGMPFIINRATGNLTLSGNTTFGGYSYFNNAIYCQSSCAGIVYMVGNYMNGYQFGFGWGTQTANLASISVNNGAVAYVLANASDARVKLNIAPSTFDSLAMVNSFPLREFNWRHFEDPDDERGAPTSTDKVSAVSPYKVRVGMIAQQIHKLFPEGVYEGDDTVDKLGRVWGFDANVMLGLLVGAVQQLSARVQILEAR